MQLNPSERFPLRVTWPWLAGAVLLCFAAAASWSNLPDLRAQGTHVDQKIALLETALRARPTATQIANQSQDISGLLEAPERLSTVVHDLQDLAAHHGLALLDASYKPAANAARADIGKVEVNVRLKGAYQPLKKSIAGLLGAHKSLALESLALRRGTSIDAILEMDLKFTFYYRKRA